MNIPRPFHLVCLALTALLVSGCAIDAQTYTAEGSFDRAFPTGGAVNIDVTAGSGSIQVRTAGENVVRVIGRIRARDSRNAISAGEHVKRLEADPPIQQTGNIFRIGEIQDPTLRDDTTISYEITVPIDARVRSRSGSGSHLLEGVRGPVDASAGSGDIHIGQTGGEVRVSAGSGNIEIERVTGAVVAMAGSGSIRASEVVGAVSARTGSGRIDVARTAAGPIDVVAGSGDITVTGARGPLRMRASSGDIVADGQPTGTWDLTASSGDVTVRVPTGASFDLDARSSSGAITTTHPVTMTGGINARRRLQGEVRGGGARLDVTTSSGSIRIE